MAGIIQSKTANLGVSSLFRMRSASPPFTAVLTLNPALLRDTSTSRRDTGSSSAISTSSNMRTTSVLMSLDVRHVLLPLHHSLQHRPQPLHLQIQLRVCFIHTSKVRRAPQPFQLQRRVKGLLRRQGGHSSLE